MKFTAACITTLSAVLPLVSAVSPRSILKARQANAQTQLFLDPSVIAPNFANDGQDPPVAGQVASLTSTNNFINFCIGKTNTNGLQITGGSCNSAPIGEIPSTANMPSAKWVFPKNGGSVVENTDLTVQVAIKNLVTVQFVNAQKSYFAAPQQLKGGQILGHSHAVIELLTSLDQTTTTDPNKFVFFKGLNDAAQNGILSATVTPGLPAGAYRICTINSSSNHQPVIAPIAQHGSLDDCSYFTVTPAGAAAGNAGKGAGAAAATTAAAAAAATQSIAPDVAANRKIAADQAAKAAADRTAIAAAAATQSIAPDVAANRKIAADQAAKTEADRAAIAASRNKRRVIRFSRSRLV